MEEEKIVKKFKDVKLTDYFTLANVTDDTKFGKVNGKDFNAMTVETNRCVYINPDTEIIVTDTMETRFYAEYLDFANEKVAKFRDNLIRSLLAGFNLNDYNEHEYDEMFKNILTNII